MPPHPAPYFQCRTLSRGVHPAAVGSESGHALRVASDRVHTQQPQRVPHAYVPIIRSGYNESSVLNDGPDGARVTVQDGGEGWGGQPPDLGGRAHTHQA